MKILSIEDDANICTLIKRVLEAADIGVTDFRCISTLEAGLSELECFTPDLILLDLKLPRADGGGYWSAEETIRHLPELSRVAPVIVLSGYADAHFVNAIQCGAADCLSKTTWLQPRHEAFFAHQIALALAHWKKDHAAA